MATTTTRKACRALFTFLVVLGVSASDDFGPSPDVDTLDIKNNCSYRVAPVIAPIQGSPALTFTAVELKGYEYVLGIPMPHGWSGRIWGRTDCSTDGTGKFACATGDCGSGRLECDGGGGVGPAPAPAAATVAEFVLGGKNGTTDTYDISLADGYNLPMLVAPYDTSRGSGGGQCAPTRCVVDLDGGACPADQQVNASGRVVACRPSGSSGALENACPAARSHAVVDAAAGNASTGFSCAAVNNTYTVTFCPDDREVPENSSPWTGTGRAKQQRAGGIHGGAQDRSWAHRRPAPAPPPPALPPSSSVHPAKRPRPGHHAHKQTVPACSVQGCDADLSGCRDYHRRHKVCKAQS